MPVSQQIYCRGRYTYSCDTSGFYNITSLAQHRDALYSLVPPETRVNTRTATNRSLHRFSIPVSYQQQLTGSPFIKTQHASL